MSSLDARAAHLAARQHGVVSRRQLLALGFGSGAIDRRITAARLLPLHRGVFAVGHAAVGLRGAWMAAALAGGDGAAISHGTAAMLLGLLPAARATPHVTTPRALGSRAGLVLHRGARRESITVRDRIPCTTVARTLVDVAAARNDAATARAWSAAASRRLVRPEQIERELVRGRAGAAQVRELLERYDSQLAQRTRSDLERRLLLSVNRAGLAPPAVNRLLRIGDRFVEADLLWATPRLVVELDGWSSHGNPSAFASDRQRDVELQLAGWRVARLTWDDVVQRERDTIDRLRALLSQPALPPAAGWSALVSERAATRDGGSRSG